MKNIIGSLWNHYRGEPNNAGNNPLASNNADPITNSASFKYKSNVTGKTSNNDNDDNNTLKGATNAVPLKYFSNCWIMREICH